MLNESSSLIAGDIVTRSTIFVGTQEDAWGPVDRAMAKIALKMLQKNAPAAIVFHKHSLVARLEGGTCSAMSLKFLSVYLELKRRSSDLPIPEFRLKVLHTLKESEHVFKKSSSNYRVVQAALNAFEIKQGARGEDLSKTKVQAMLNYYDIMAHEGLESEFICFEPFDLSEYTRIVKGLHEGAFLVRFIRSANNEKLEEYGHTMVYIKEKGLILFYDPNEGLKNHFDLVENVKHFIGCANFFKMNFLRFYEVGLTVAQFKPLPLPVPDFCFPDTVFPVSP